MNVVSKISRREFQVTAAACLFYFLIDKIEIAWVRNVSQYSWMFVLHSSPHLQNGNQNDNRENRKVKTQVNKSKWNGRKPITQTDRNETICGALLNRNRNWNLYWYWNFDWLQKNNTKEGRRGSKSNASLGDLSHIDNHRESLLYKELL